MESTKSKQKFTYQKLVYGLANKHFSNVVIFTGPGIGVPDFKSQDCLNFMKHEFLEDFKLPKPESLFELEYYKSKPEAFTKFAQQFLVNESLGVVDPTVAHKLTEYLAQ